MKRVRQPVDPVVRFWRNVRKGDLCWNWAGSIDVCGYGRLWDGTRTVRAHRFSYELLVGPIPEGLVLDHLCRNTRCVNPEHLEAVTHRDNLLRGFGAAAKRARLVALSGWSGGSLLGRGGSTLEGEGGLSVPPDEDDFAALREECDRYRHALDRIANGQISGDDMLGPPYVVEGSEYAYRNMLSSFEAARQIATRAIDGNFR
jgi:hypothetical protein